MNGGCDILGKLLDSGVVRCSRPEFRSVGEEGDIYEALPNGLGSPIEDGVLEVWEDMLESAESC